MDNAADWLQAQHLKVKLLEKDLEIAALTLRISELEGPLAGLPTLAKEHFPKIYAKAVEGLRYYARAGYYQARKTLEELGEPVE